MNKLVDGKFVSDNGIKYSLYEGMSIDGESASDICFIMLDDYCELDDFCKNRDYILVGWFFGIGLIEDPEYKSDTIKTIERFVVDYEKKHPEIVNFITKKGENKYMKYNYVKASKLFKKFYDLCGDPWTAIEEEVREERRNFMRAVTHKIKDDIQLYVGIIEEQKELLCFPYPTDKSKVWDFDLMRTYDALKAEIENFEN